MTRSAMSRKRKASAKPSLLNSPMTRRLAFLRDRYRNLWDDDDDESNEDDQSTLTRTKPSKRQTKKKVCVVLSDSEEEVQRPLCRSSNSTAENHRRSSPQPRNASHCLICSIHSQLSNINCCSHHLSILTNNPNAQSLANHVMIVPITDDILQRYLDPEHIHALRNFQSPTECRSVSNVVSSSQKSPRRELEHSRSSNSSKKSTNHDTIISIDDSDDQNSTPAENPPPIVFTPTTVRRTATDVMAAVLPKIPLKSARFRHGKPISSIRKTPPSMNSSSIHFEPASPAIFLNSPHVNVDNQDLATNQAMATSSSPVQTEQNIQLPVDETESTRPLEILNSAEDLNISTENQTNATSFVTFRTNPNGSRVRISRPSISSLRRTSTDVTPKEM